MTTTDRAQADAILRDAGVAWEPGMLTMTGARVVSVSASQLALSVGPPSRVGWYPAAQHVPSLRDPATYALCLAQLARRLGLDPEQGAVLVKWRAAPAGNYHRDVWRITTPAYEHAYLWDIPTDIDHRQALALALRATAPKETT